MLRSAGAGAERDVALGGRDGAGWSTITFGRDEQNDVVLRIAGDQFVSRFHASVMCSGQNCMLKAGNTLNGTYVNGRRMPPCHSHRLRDGDVVAFGGPPYLWLGGALLKNPFVYEFAAGAAPPKRARARAFQAEEPDFGCAVCQV